MGILVAVAARLMTRRGPYILSQTQGDLKLYFKGDRLPKPDFIGLRPGPRFSMVNRPDDASRYQYWLAAWHYRQALQRSSHAMSDIHIEQAPQA